MAKDKHNNIEQNTFADAAPPPGYVPPGADGFGAHSNVPPHMMPPTPDQLEEMALSAEISANEMRVKRLKRIKGPCNFLGCLIALLLFVLITIGLALLVIFLFVDRFEVLTVLADLWSHVAAGFRFVWNFFRVLFSGLFGWGSGNGGGYYGGGY